MIIKGEKGRLIITLSYINTELYPAILRSLLRVLQQSGEELSLDDRQNLLLLLDDLMPEEKQIQKMIEAACTA